jgi:hypothetical protein
LILDVTLELAKKGFRPGPFIGRRILLIILLSPLKNKPIMRE